MTNSNDNNKPHKKFPVKLVLVMMILGAFVGVFLQTLTHAPDKNTALLHKPIPEFKLVDLQNPEIIITDKDILQNAPAMVNVWASWCVPCRAEHKMIKQLATEHQVKIFGLNYKDKLENGQNFLKTYGNPYFKVMNDADGIESLQWGLRGVPETFVIDKNGKITYRHTGEIKQSDIQTLLTEFKKASE